MKEETVVSTKKFADFARHESVVETATLIM
jgi:hypothetical protein